MLNASSRSSKSTVLASSAREVLLEGDRERDLRLQHTDRLLGISRLFQRTQYLEINNPINTPTVFASMS